MSGSAREQISWKYARALCTNLGEQIKESGFAASILIGVARGGWVPARLLSDVLDVRHVASIGVTYSGSSRGHPVIYSSPTGIDAGARILLIEDTLETGESLGLCRQFFEDRLCTVRTAAIYVTSQTEFSPDYSLGCVARVPVWPWDGEWQD